MPSEPQPLSTRVLVEHITGSRKYVLRSQLDQMGEHWHRIPEPADEAESVEEPAADGPPPAKKAAAKKAATRPPAEAESKKE